MFHSKTDRQRHSGCEIFNPIYMTSYFPKSKSSFFIDPMIPFLHFGEDNSFWCTGLERKFTLFYMSHPIVKFYNYAFLWKMVSWFMIIIIFPGLCLFLLFQYKYYMLKTCLKWTRYWHIWETFFKHDPLRHIFVGVKDSSLSRSYPTWWTIMDRKCKLLL